MLNKRSISLLIGMMFLVGSFYFFRGSSLTSDEAFLSLYLVLFGCACFLYEEAVMEAKIALGAFLILLLWTAYYFHKPDILYLLPPSAILVFLLTMLLRGFFKEKLLQAQQGQKSLESKIANLTERLENKKQTLQNIERQASDIINLFEVAKHFNEALAISDLLEILRTQVAQILPFSALTLILPEGQPGGAEQLDVCLVTEDKTVQILEASVLDDHFVIANRSRSFLKLAREHRGALRLDFQVQLMDYFDKDFKQGVFPLWLFPLVVEHQMIAVFVVEGAQANHFVKFSIIASQLALQIKKIKLYEEVKELSITDGLTQVFLRRHFMERFDEELRRSIKYDYAFCVLMIDIDHFKDFNDNFGHLVGDVTLKEVAKTIKETIRKVDLIGRYGGEEFILLLPETNKVGGVDAAERIRSAVAKRKLDIYDIETRVTLSVGLSCYPDDLDQKPTVYDRSVVDGLIQIADQYLYQAKDDGRNRVKYRQ